MKFFLTELKQRSYNVSNELIVKQFKNQDVRVLLIDGNPWWVARDLCGILGLVETHKALERIGKDDRNTAPVTDKLGRQQETSIINEAGLYSLIFKSRREEAKTFQHWVTHEVLPSIRKTGTYSLQKQIPQNYAKALLEAARLETERARLQIENDKLNPLAIAYRNLVETEGLYSWSEAAKALANNFPDIGRNRLTAILKKHGYLMQSKSCEPYQRYLEAGLFRVKLITYTDKNGVEKTCTTTLATQKGLDKIQKILSGRETLGIVVDDEPIKISFDLDELIDIINNNEFSVLYG